ncbi:phage scaffolding protein [Cohnella silvisoli]|uniref:Phage scaffolding protein n=1 Tax=Cohnella silvisoli TaxID=2873699 RepID=A0ABV1L346_9BACL|nr:phage scaffolding protein [Cohnella silvisoli]MCD9026040.1 phage scaffolding protein [Cohnella silvisoli]
MKNRIKMNLQLFAETADLKSLLGEELYNQVTAKLGDKHKVAIVSDGSYIPKETFNQVNEAKKQAEADLKDRDGQLTTLKKSAGDNEDLKKQIQTLQDDNKKKDDDYKVKLGDLAMTSSLRLKLAGQVHDADLVIGQLDKTKIKLNDAGEIIDGYDDQVKTLRESKSFLFTGDASTTPSGITPHVGGGGNPPVDTSKMTDEQFFAHTIALQEKK